MNKQIQEFTDQLMKEVRELPELRHGQDILSLGLFYRYLSDSLQEYFNEILKDQNYLELTDEEAEQYKDKMLEDLGYFFYPSQLKFNEFITIENLIKRIKSIEWLNTNITDSIRSLNFYFDILKEQSNKVPNEIIAQILNYPFRHNEDYRFVNNLLIEELERKFVREMVFVPESLAKLLSQLAIQENKEVKDIYDFSSRAGSLLLKTQEALNPEDKSVDIYGQEIYQRAYLTGLTNLILNNIPPQKIHLIYGNILKEPKKFNKKTFELIISYPPFGKRWNPQIRSDKYHEFIGLKPYVSEGIQNSHSLLEEIPFSVKADLDFVLHTLSQLSEDGTGVLLLNTSVLRVGNRERVIRQYLIENNYIDSVIQLPSKVLNGTGIAPSIMVLKKNKDTDDVLFIDASEDFESVRPYLNILSDKNIKDIISVFNNRESILNKSQVIKKERIEEEDYNLLPSLYIESEEKNEFKNSKKLKELLKSIQIGNYRKSSKATDNGLNNTYVVNINDLKNNLITDVNSLNEVSSKNLKKVLELDDIILSKNFDSFEGALYQLTETDKPVIAAGNTFILKVDPDQIDPLYLLYYLTSTVGKNQISKRIPKAGRIRGIDRKTLENLEIPMVDIEKQRKIGKDYLKLLNERSELKRKLEEKQNKIESFPLEEVE